MSTGYIIAPLVGLLSGLHCLGMCGGILGALTFSLPEQVRRDPPRLMLYLAAYNLGRVLSYALIGAIFGWMGAVVFSVAASGPVVVVLRNAAAAVTMMIGLYIAGWFPGFAAIERLGEPVWRRLEPLGRRLLPVRSPTRALLYGAVWGWLPCGLVYAMLLGAPAQGSAAAGAVYMSLFGLGTLPVLFGTGLLAGRLRDLGRARAPRAIGGLAVVALGLYTLLFQSI